MRAIEFIIESNNIASAEQVWDYVDGVHPKDQQGGGFLKSLVMRNPQYELKRVPLSSLHVPNDEDEGNDPYGRAMFVDADHAREYSQHHIDKKPLVIDSQGHILDGAHRAWAAVELLNKTDIMAWVPVKQSVAEGKDFDRCFDQACKLYDRAVSKNLEPKLVQVADFQGDGNGADPRWMKLPQHVWQHYVVIVGDQVLDPTAKQFGDSMPTQYQVSDLDRLWGQQYQIRPRQGVAEGATNNIPTIGINVRSDGNIDYASLIVDGKKKYESRRTDSLRPYVGKTVGIVRTGNGPAVAIGQVTIGEPIEVDVEKFNKLRNQHLVPQGSKFDIESDSTKYLYPMINPVRWDNEKPIKSKGIVSRKIDEAKLSVDVPNEDWLQEKIDYAKSKGRNSYGVPYMGSTTAGVVGTPPRVRVMRLASLPGMRNEQMNVRKSDLKWLMDYMEKTGKLPPMGNSPDREYLPYIMVAYNGEAWVNEGNHRIMAAYRLNWQDMPIEIRYFDGGERIKTGPMAPEKIGL